MNPERYQNCLVIISRGSPYIHHFFQIRTYFYGVQQQQAIFHKNGEFHDEWQTDRLKLSETHQARLTKNLKNIF